MIGSQTLLPSAFEQTKAKVVSTGSFSGSQSAMLR